MRVVPCEQGTEAWARARRGIPTASCADRIITPAKGDWSKSAEGYACELIAESMVPPHYWIGSDIETRDMANGKRDEEEARDYFAMERGIEVEQVGFVLTDDGRFGCSPDGLVGSEEGLELKCPKHATQIRYLYDGVMPVAYMPQVHWSLAVTRRKAWWFVSYATGLAPLVVRVEPNEYTVKVTEAMERFHKLLTDMRAKIEGTGDPIAATRPEYVSPF